MKGKILSLKIVLTLLLLLTASFCFVANPINETKNSTKTIVALEKVKLGTDEEEFSALADGGVILSVEKVKVNSNETEYQDEDENTYSYPNLLMDGAHKTFYGSYDAVLEKHQKDYEKDNPNPYSPSSDAPVYNSGNESYDSRLYTFMDIPNKDSSKTVVEDGKFVKLDNTTSSGKIVMPDDDKFQEAVMISFGAYVLDQGVIETAINDDPATTDINETFCAKITQLEVEVHKDGKKQTNIPNVRNIGTAGTGLYFDFCYLITQEEDNSNEGYYQLSFKYLVNYVEYNANFEFYILNNSTYNQQVKPNGQDLGYESRPTLGWIESGANSEFVKNPNNGDNYVRYMIGYHGISSDYFAYPTITYDYTKYKLTYDHIANQKKTSYDLSVSYKKTGEASLIMTATSSSGTTTTPFELVDYHELNLNNFVTIMFTEPGTYEFNSVYLYRGYNSNVAPDLDFAPITTRLSIHGMSVQYSKTNQESANLQYFELAYEEGNNVDLIIPNGYELSSELEDNQTLGFVYKLIKRETLEGDDASETKMEREGNILSSNSLNSLMNGTLLNSSHNSTEDSDLKYLTEERTDVDATNKEVTLLRINDEDQYTSEIGGNIQTILDKIEYVETNQGSLWIQGNDKFTSNSFYYYSPTNIELFKIDDGGTPANAADDTWVSTDLTSSSFTNITTFNKKGYYLAFIEVEPSGMASSNSFWQIFAFQYTASSVNINIKAVDDKGTEETADDTRVDVAGGKFTNKPVEISWVKPGVFDREILGYYYLSKNEVKDKDQLLKTDKEELVVVEEKVYNGEICCVAQLGDRTQIPENSFGKYLIRLESEGDSATLKTFTIDRQPIAGVQPYLIQAHETANSIYYSFKTDVNNQIIPIDNSVTDSYATLKWDDKDSNADITATYSFTPFEIATKTDAPVNMMNGNNGADWVLSNYVLGNTSFGLELVRPVSESLVSGESVLFSQGIYLITLKDEAGNETVYAFVIDRTNGYFKIGEGEDSQFVTNTTVVSGENIEFDIGEYKAFKLDLTPDTDLQKFVNAAATNDYTNFPKYYSDAWNKTSLSKLFQKNGSDYYFTIENIGVVTYDGELLDKDPNAPTEVEDEIIYDESENSTYYHRTIYIKSINSVYTTHNSIYNTSNSYINAIINKDNARGAVYHSNVKIDIDNVPEFGQETQNIKLLDTGKGDTHEQGISKAEATSAKHVGFTWIKGSGQFEVSKVYYKIYSLSQNSWDNNPETDNVYFYYSNDSDPIMAYANGEAKPGTTDEGERCVISFNNNNESKAGLYVVTREYKEIENADLGEDVRIRNYYFIVDRNGIIQGEVGGNIKLELMEGQTELSKSDFSLQNADYGVLDDEESGISNEKYYIYLSTTKLPATLNIPTGKYVDENNHSSSLYEAGKLDVRVYYINTKNQIKGQPDQIKIYDSIYMANKDKLIVGADGTYTIDIYEYLSYENIVIRDLLTESSSGTNKDRREWLFLPGRYVVRISDNVKDSSEKKQVKLIGFEIVSKDETGPEIDKYTGSTKQDMIKLNELSSGTTENNFTVSQEYLKVVLPPYDENIETRAQVDPSYIVVKQYVGNSTVGEDYLIHDYVPGGAISLTENSKFVTIDDNGTENDKSDDLINIWLDTKLRVDPDDPNSEIDYDNLNKALRYEITIRYKLNNLKDSNDRNWTKENCERYKNCYIYYTDNNELVEYYQTTYTIRIDREAPSKNITELNTNDPMANDYVTDQEVDSMFENGVHRTGSNLYFTKQYSKYYQTNRENKGHIYAYMVYGKTIFDWTDVNKVLVKKIGTYADLAQYNLTLPVVDEGSYNKVEAKERTYGQLGEFNESNTYYEVVEFDFAGNATQYVIHYEPVAPMIEIPIIGTLTTSGEKSVKITLDENEQINIFELKLGNWEEFRRNDNFYKIELFKSGKSIYSVFTNATTDYEKELQTIVEKIEKEKFGFFTITITSRKGEIVDSRVVLSKVSSSININLFNSEDVIPLDIEDLIIKGDSYKIDLNGANIYDEEKEIWYFATQIVLISGNSPTPTIYTGTYDSSLNSIIYTNEAGDEKRFVDCDASTTYYIEMKEVVGTVTKYRFNTAGREFVVLDFEDVNGEEANYYRGSLDTDFVYYGFSSATLKYDETIYSSTIYKKNNGEYKPLDRRPDGSYSDPRITSFSKNDGYYEYNIAEPVNELIEVKIELIYDGDVEITYFITIDTRISNVVLRDYNTAETRNIIQKFSNKNYYDDSIRANSVGSGIMNLQWDNIEGNDYFDYKYRLYEELKDDKGYRKYKLINGVYVEDEEGEIGLKLNGKNSTVIATGNDSEGVYVFEIRVYGKDGTYLGNRLFAFEVKEVNTQVYYVRNQEGAAIQPNSWFKFTEVPSILANATEFNNVNKNLELPLYITNQNLEVVITAMNIEPISKTYSPKDEKGNTIYELTIHKLSKPNVYDIVFGVIKYDVSSQLVTNVQIIGEQNYEVGKTTNFTIAGLKNTSVSISGDVNEALTALGGDIAKKNIVYINAYYNDELISSTPFNNEYTIPGNGQYSFTFTDLAGNVHEFIEDEDGNSIDSLDLLKVYVMREVVVLINGEAPVSNAFYNNNVTLTLYASNKYVTGSVEVKAEKNGQTYIPEGYNPYIFSDYGTYRVVITAKYNNGTNNYDLQKIITFTIINVNEARKSIDLTSLNGSTITKVVNSSGQNVTTAFKTMMKQNSTKGGLNISYEDVLEYETNPENKDKLFVTSGKITFTLTYLVSDEEYPDRSIDLSFTLTNKTASIPCTLEKGESTTKSFTIYFNPSIIYEQVGESYVYINDKMVAHIGENSDNNETKIKISFKGNGDGDYYIKLVSSSGVILDSYKLTIKEPLNASAIIIIIVVVVVVATVVVTIILLRRKMRIR